MPRRKTNKEFVKEVYELVGDEYEFLEEYVGSTIKILCRHNECGNEWEIRPSNFLYGSRCPNCHQNAKKSNKQFVKEIYKLVGNEYEFLEEYINNGTKIKCRHNECGHIWEIRPNAFLRGNRCPNCHKKNKKSNKQFVKEIYKLVGNKYEFLEEYINNETKIKCRHNECGHIWETTPSVFLSGSRCPQCAIETKTKSHEDFTEEVYNLIENEYTFLDEYVNAKTKIKCRHNECGHIWKISPNAFLRGRRCPVCVIKETIKTNQQFIKEVYNLVKNEYTFLEPYKGSKNKIKCKHNECGYEWEVQPRNFLFGTRCPKCNSSKGEKRIMKYLEENNLKFKREYYFNDLTVKSYLPFDFAIKQNGRILFLIEYDGVQHFDPNNYFHKTEKSFGYGKYKDRVKTAYCINNNIPLLRIPYFKKHLIEELIDEMLEKFDLLKTV